MSASSAEASACPVRHGDRTAGVCPVRHGSTENPPALGQTSAHPFIAVASTPAGGTSPSSNPSLGQSREASSIPVASPEELPKHQQTANAVDGNTTWLYPSEKMFFDAMKRKGWQPDEQDMGNVVKIHNIVNEQAWRHILHWEQLHSSHCNCPKLKRFEGRPKDYSPRARLLNAVGYKLPFDRHDWYVDRCGNEVRYVIDFYNARAKGSAGGMFLDVRPALDSPGAVLDRMRMSIVQWFHWW